jgi:RNA polymerase sigma-70 factor (ECF subfamily)
VDYTDAPDEVIIDGIRRGDGRAVAALYDRYGSLVFSLGLRMLGNREAAEELVQEAFLRAWRQIATYQPSLGRVSNWLLGIARNLAIDEMRRRGARPQTVSNDESDDQITQLAASRDEDPAEQVQASARSAEIRRALDALPPAQREVMELAYYGGLTQSEIAARLGDPLGTVKTRMRLATQKLRDLLRETNQVPQ